MTINTYVKQLQDDVLSIRVNKDKSELAQFKQALLISLKQKAKSLNLELVNITLDTYLEVVKKRYKDSRNAAIMIVSKSDDSNIGTKLVPELNKDDLKITYDDLTLVQILLLNSINSSLINLVKELEYLDSLLPKQLTEDEMLSIIKDNNLSNIGSIMKYFKLTYNNQFDNKLLSKVAKTI